MADVLEPLRGALAALLRSLPPWTPLALLVLVVVVWLPRSWDDDSSTDTSDYGRGGEESDKAD